MPEVLLHYCGLGPQQHTWYYNKRGAFVHVYPNEWVRLDLDRHPEVSHSIKTGVAVVKEAAPARIEILDEDTYSGGRYRFPPALTKPGAAQGLCRTKGHPRAYQLSKNQIERIAQCYLWPEQPAELGIGYVKDYPAGRRGPKPEVPRLATTMHPVFAKNFAVLCRLAELLARQVGPDPLPGAGMRRKKRITTILTRWGVWRKQAAPSAASLHRYRAWLGLTRWQLDLAILSRLPTRCVACGCRAASAGKGKAKVPCHRWDKNTVCPHCGKQLPPSSTRVHFL